ncbi:unnamed protein product [Sphagnum troendelagicum]|uniref:Ribosomal protein S27 n=1 Tax=Sphagnum troendelagicum TaxID=128251 RepID=A0ABP0TPI0_9BRYO
MKGVSNDIDLLNPPPELEQKKHKLKRLVPSPNSFFMVRGCEVLFISLDQGVPILLGFRTIVFSHSQTVVLCTKCSSLLCQPTGGQVRLTEGCSFRKKHD